MTLRRVLVVGTGLIGTSVALALRGSGLDVTLADADAGHLDVAVDMGAGRAYDAGDSPADHAVLAVPPRQVAPALLRTQRDQLAAGASDVASVKSAPLAAAAALGCDLSAFTGGHPVAGLERSGPAAALADLFLGRQWVLTPTRETDAAVLADAREIAQRCGAIPVIMTSEAHDRALALVSHAPQLTASALAALLADVEDADDEVFALAGQGLRDVTRIAASDAALWTEIATGNAEPLADVLARVSAGLAEVAAALRAGDDRPVTELLVRGAVGRARLPGASGARPATD